MFSELTSGSLFGYPSKTIRQWNYEDVSEWLSQLGLECYIGSFREMKVDGYLILDLTDEDMKEELNIQSKLHRKKLINAINELKKGNGRVSAQNLSMNSRTNDDKGAIWRGRTLDSFNSSAQSEQNVPFSEPKGLTIISLEAEHELSLRIVKETVNIGRHSSNEIAIFDESISRHHAKIQLVNQEYYLSDLGSISGTYVRIEGNLPLDKGVIFEMGSTTFEVIDSYFSLDSPCFVGEPYVFLVVLEGMVKVGTKFVMCHNSTIGRKSTNEINFPDDIHLSNIHAKIVLISNKFVIEDMGSTNGIWHRLSSEGIPSKPYLIDRDLIFKIGGSSTYQIKQTSSHTKKQQDEEPEKGPLGDNCSVCWDSDKDCLFMPCRHNVSCLKCAKLLKKCPFCRETILDLIKIYK